MKTATIYHVHRTRTGAGMIDKDMSIPEHEVPDEIANAFMKMCEAEGYKRHETATQIFYDKQLDGHTTVEEIFYK